MSSLPRRSRLEIEDIGDVTVVKFLDKKILHEQNVQLIGEQLFRLVDKDGRRKVLLKLENVEFLSSAAVGKILTLHNKLRMAGGRMAMCDTDPQIMEVWEMTNMNKYRCIFATEIEALEFLAGSPGDDFLVV